MMLPPPEVLLGVIAVPGVLS